MATKIVGEELLGQRGRRIRDEALMARRAAQMSILYHDHFWTLDHIGAAFGCSRERVRQIFNEYNMPTRGPFGSESPTRPGRK